MIFGPARKRRWAESFPGEAVELECFGWGACLGLDRAGGEVLAVAGRQVQGQAALLVVVEAADARTGVSNVSSPGSILGPVLRFKQLVQNSLEDVLLQKGGALRVAGDAEEQRL